MKQPASRKQRQITSAPSGRPARTAQPLITPVRRPPRRMKFLRWLSTSKWVLILGVIIMASILTVMYYRLTSPDAAATPVPTAGTPQALHLQATPAETLASSPLLALL